MNVGAVQLLLHGKKTDEAITEAESEVRRASQRGARLVCLPEHWLLSYVSTPADGLVDKFGALASELGVFINLGAFYELRSGKTHLTSVTVSPKGEVVGRQDKIHLYRRENRTAVPGTELGLISIDRFKVGVVVCHDLVFPEVAREATLAGADLLLVPSLIGARGEEPWATYLRARALENRVPIVSPNAYFPPRVLGKSSIVDLRYDLKSHVMELAVQTIRSGAGSIVRELDLTSLRAPRKERLEELSAGRFGRRPKA